MDGETFGIVQVVARLKEAHRAAGFNDIDMIIAMLVGLTQLLHDEGILHDIENIDTVGTTIKQTITIT